MCYCCCLNCLVFEMFLDQIPEFSFSESQTLTHYLRSAWLIFSSSVVCLIIVSVVTCTDGDLFRLHLTLLLFRPNHWDLTGQDSSSQCVFCHIDTFISLVVVQQIPVFQPVSHCSDEFPSPLLTNRKSFSWFSFCRSSNNGCCFIEVLAKVSLFFDPN